MKRWLDAGGDGVGLTTVRSLLDTLLELPGLPTLIAPPGSTADVDVGLVDVDVEASPSPKLVTIRGLLAKAESTEFPAEAEAFTAKAQAMMIEARLDEATVRASLPGLTLGTSPKVREIDAQIQLANGHAGLQCENCHGPQEYTQSHRDQPGAPRVSLAADVCGSCHGEPARHGRFQQWQVSKHANYELAGGRAPGCSPPGRFDGRVCDLCGGGVGAAGRRGPMGGHAA